MARPGAHREDVLTPDGLSRFYAENLPAVYGYLERLTGGDRALAEDLTQDTFLALTSELRRGRVERADVRWLLTVARSRYIDHIRREARGQRKLRLIAGQDDSPALEDEPSRADVLARVARLEPLHRVVLMMRYIDGLAVGDIAIAIDRTTTATYSLLARARAQLRNVEVTP